MANDCVILAQVVPCDGGTGAATAGCKEARPICVESGGQDFVLARGDPFFDGRVHCRSNARILLDIAFFCHESSAPFQREFGSGQTAKSRLRLAPMLTKNRNPKSGSIKTPTSPCGADGNVQTATRTWLTTRSHISVT